MRVNSRVFDEKKDLFDNIKLPNCPTELRTVAESLMMLVTKPGYSSPIYRSVTQLDKILIWEYWTRIDGLKAILDNNNQIELREWFVNKATSADLISRSVRWLNSHNYLLLDPVVQERAMAARDRWQKSISR